MPYMPNISQTTAITTDTFMIAPADVNRAETISLRD